VSQVNVTINGRQFRMACEDGQESHLQQLAKDLDERIAALRGQFGEIGDARLTVMAALMVADELAESAKKAQRLEKELATLHDAQGRLAGRGLQHRGRADRGARKKTQPSRRGLRQRGAGLKAVPDSADQACWHAPHIRITLPVRGCGVR